MKYIVETVTQHEVSPYEQTTQPPRPAALHNVPGAAGVTPASASQPAGSAPALGAAAIRLLSGSKVKMEFLLKR